LIRKVNSIFAIKRIIKMILVFDLSMKFGSKLLPAFDGKFNSYLLNLAVLGHSYLYTLNPFFSGSAEYKPLYERVIKLSGNCPVTKLPMRLII